MAKKNKRRWYIVQTYSGDENTVKTDLERRIESMGMTEYIFKVIVPEIVIPPKNEDEKEKVERLFPGYVFVEMIVTDESWFVVRNTPGVTGFLGSSGGGTKPIPVLKEEMEDILLKIGEITKPTYDHLIGETVQITKGPWAGMDAQVLEVHEDQEEMVLTIEAFGQATRIVVGLNEIREKEE